MRSNPQRLAWITLLGGLALFILACVSAVVFLNWLVFKSPTQLNVTVHVGRGSVGLAMPDTSDEKAVRGTASIEHGDHLSTDSFSQGYLAFTDPYSGKLIATVTLRKDSVVRLSSATRPRFSLSQNPYAIRLVDVNGRLDVWVNPNLDREIRLDIESTLGVTRIGDGGSYQIDSTPVSLKVTTREGSAILVTKEGQAHHLASESEVTVQQGSSAITLGQAPVELLPNSTFVLADNSQGPWPVEWTCTNYPSPDNPNGPTGEYRFEAVDGRPAIHIQRLQPEPGPGGTGCEQFLADRERGLDVSQYTDLRLRVTMQIRYQQLSACGVAGSECPVMLRLDYLDQYGTPRVWYHGFYADYTPNVGRTRCDSCWEEHEKINKDAWYTYESGNLLTDFPEGLRPASIIEVRFYASGHQYDVLLNEVSLLATQSPGSTAATSP